MSKIPPLHPSELKIGLSRLPGGSSRTWIIVLVVVVVAVGVYFYMKSRKENKNG